MNTSSQPGGDAALPQVHLRLFIAGNEPNSRKARQTLKNLCETRLKGKYTLEIVDVLQDFQAALENHVLVAPTLIVLAPQPPATIIGSLADIQKVLTALGLPADEDTE
ncbi:MAG: circadian clock protein KaiB [Chloroflexi bacterium]|nr:MAG: circadian clock protein KaiB [Chloroflexota bacterium]